MSNDFALGLIIGGGNVAVGGGSGITEYAGFNLLGTDLGLVLTVSSVAV